MTNKLDIIKDGFKYRVYYNSYPTSLEFNSLEEANQYLKGERNEVE